MMDPEQSSVNEPLLAPHPNKNRYMLGIITLSISFFFIFLAFNGTQTIESSIIPGKLGYWALGTLYIAFAAACLVFSAAGVYYLTPRWAMFIGSITYALYIAANIYPTWGTLMPGAVLIGIGASIIWAGEGAYLTAAASSYAAAAGKRPQECMGLFNGIFFGIFQLTNLVGNVLSSVILGQQDNDNSEASKILFYVYCGICCLGVVILLFVPKSKSVVGTVMENKTVLQRILAVFRQLKDLRMLFLIPLLFYTGIEQGFLFGDYTANEIKPILGVEWVGYVMAVFGACDSIGSFVFGKMADMWGKRWLVVVGFILHGLCLGVLLGSSIISGTENNELFTKYPSLIFVWAAIYGFGDAVWFGVFSNAILCTFFTDDTETAFSNLKLWQSLGFAVSFFWGPVLSMTVKTSLITAGLFVATLFLIILDRFVVSLNSTGTATILESESQEATETATDTDDESINSDHRD